MTTAGSAAGAAPDEGTLRVELEIRPPEEPTCPIAAVEGEVRDIRVNAVDGECNGVVRVADGDGGTDLIRTSAAVDERCLCRVFQQCGCVPQIRDVEDRRMLVSTYVDDRVTLRELIGALQQITESVRLRRLTADVADGDRLATVDLGALTDKQREALELAVVRGYYDEEREVDLASMAAELDISKSALSQRLRAAQSKLIGDLFGEN